MHSFLLQLFTYFFYINCYIHVFMFLYYVIKVSEDFLTTIDNVLDASLENVFESQTTANSSSRYIWERHLIKHDY